MINFDKHTIRLGTGYVDINVLESPSGAPVLAFSNSEMEFSVSGSLFVGFDNAESIDGLISILRSIRRSYYPKNRKTAFSDTQRFDF